MKFPTLNCWRHRNAYYSTLIIVHYKHILNHNIVPNNGMLIRKSTSFFQLAVSPSCNLSFGEINQVTMGLRELKSHLPFFLNKSSYIQPYLPQKQKGCSFTELGYPLSITLFSFFTPINSKQKSHLFLIFYVTVCLFNLCLAMTENKLKSL